ncbi:MAG: quinate 5-dehydrogenase [Chloroflexi bacterium HGW-Chloroflexi-10]|nr:MAG: quinate 5-dehydrogenase [Chloroflexi bacterium HGW-Chloroflexi-10]
MKRAVSVSIGSSSRDKAVSMELFGETVHLERIGTDGDMEKAARLFQELDGQVDAFGVGGAILGLLIDRKWYDFHSVMPLVSHVQHTPVADGTGLKDTLERQAAVVVEPLLDGMPRRVFHMSAVDRYGLARGFLDSGYESVFGDLMFALGIPIAMHSDAALKRMARMLIPIMTRLPFNWVYPTGEKQNQHTPKFGKFFEWATVIAGDCHYITKYMPHSLEGKIIVTNTTTQTDRELFKAAGVRYLVTTTPMLEGRSFGTNMMEASILAAKGWKEPINYANPKDYFQRMTQAVADLGMKPKLQEL